MCEALASERLAHQEHEEHVRDLVNKLTLEREERKRLALELEQTRAKKREQVQKQNTTFRPISTPRENHPPLVVRPEQSVSGAELATESSSSSTSEADNNVSPLPSTRHEAKKSRWRSRCSMKSKEFKRRKPPRRLGWRNG
eukprot:4974447-Amphidinium_carterae.1